jgi:hypothetical protein
MEKHNRKENDMATEGQTEQSQSEFVSTYGWLLAPGDHMQADYTSPTCVKTWLQANPLTFATEDKQKAYGQWIAQLLQSQLGLAQFKVDLMSLYKKPPSRAEQWPFTLRHDVIKALDKYFKGHMK